MRRRGGLEAAVWLTAFAASIGCYIALVRLDAINGAEPVARFLGLLAAAFLLYGAAVAAERRLRLDARLALPLVIAGGLALRVALLPAGLPPETSASESLELLRDDLAGTRVVYEPFLLYDSDVWRYLWDGHVWASGENPFSASPEARSDLAEDELWADVLDNVNHPSIATIYPPGAQLVFVAGHAVAPGSLLALKAIFVAFDLVAALFLAATLGRLGARPSAVILYFWNPLVIKAFAGSAHFDATVVAALAALAYFVVRGWRGAAAMSLALGLLFKLVPLVLVPFLWRRIGVRATSLALGASAVVIGAFLLHARGTAGFGRFASEWYFNAPAYAGLRFALATLTPHADALARPLATLAILGALTWLALRDDGEPDTLPRWGALGLGAPLLLGPVVMPWYVTWLFPFAVLAGQRLWLAYSAVVCLGFLVMVDGTEPAWALGLQALALSACAWAFRRDLRLSVSTDAPRVRLPRNPLCARSGCSSHKENTDVRWKMLLALMLLAIPHLAFAQGSGTPRIGASSRGDFPHNVTRSVKGIIMDIDVEQGLVLVQDNDGERFVAKADEKTKFKADKKTELRELSEAKELMLEHFEVGQAVKMRYEAKTNRLVELKLRKT